MARVKRSVSRFTGPIEIFRFATISLLRPSGHSVIGDDCRRGNAASLCFVTVIDGS